jgi:DnaJ-class molecular chaperone
MTSTRIYKHIAICRNCGGDGRTWQPTPGMPQHENGHWGTCPQCQGSGMVIVRIKSTLTITPHHPVKYEAE